MAKETVDLVKDLAKKIDLLDLTMKKLFQEQSYKIVKLMDMVSKSPELEDILKAMKPE